MNEFGLLALVMAVFNLAISTKISKSILHPVRLFALMWSVLVIIPPLLWDIEYSWAYTGLVWINLAVLSTIAGAYLVRDYAFGGTHNYLGKTSECSEQSLRKDTDYIWIILGAIVILGLMSAILSLRQNGFHISNALSLRGLLNVSSAAAIQRYTGTQSRSMVHQLLSIFVYLSAVCGGYSYNFAADRKLKFLSLISLLPIVCEMLFTSGKVGFIAAMFLWLAGWCASYVKLNGLLPKVKLRTALFLLLVFSLMVALLFFAMVLRVGTMSGKVMHVLVQKFWIYMFGQMVEFDGWFSAQDSFSDYQLGINTYMTVFKTLGFVTRTQGVYDVFVPGYGNIFTAFRGIISDFGVLGSLIYCFIRGAVTQICLSFLVSNRQYPVLPAMLFVCAYFWNLYSFIISPWIYTTYILAIIGFGVFMLLLRGKSQGSYTVKLVNWR